MGLDKERLHPTQDLKRNRDIGVGKKNHNPSQAKLVTCS
jgi:hypothetical protein